jgi:hypothetical protein
LFHEQRKHEKKEAVAESGYYILQTESINYKKDHPSILTNTCTDTLDAGCDRLKGSQLIVVNFSESGNTEHVFIPKGATIIQLRDSVVQ